MQRSTWAIRRAVPAEAGRLTALARAAKGHWGYPPDWLAAWADELAITPEYVAEHRVFVAEEAGALLGVSSIEDHGDHWMLENVWVDPGQQGRGVGKALVRCALEAAFAVRPGVVKLIADPHAAGFYERLGARRTGARPAPMPGAPERELPLFEIQAGAQAGGAAPP